MDAIGKVVVVSGLLTKASGTGGSQLKAGGESKRYLGDYVSRDKMTAVRDGCARLLGELACSTWPNRACVLIFDM